MERKPVPAGAGFLAYMSENNQTVSIIVPVYQLEKYIVTTISCVLAQTYTDWELLLVEDCSKDNTHQVITDYLAEHPDERIRLIRQEKNQGAAAARNRGVRESRGRYIAYLDGDDLWEPEKLDHELRFLKEKKAAFVFMSYEFADAEGVGTGKVVHVPERLTYRQALKNTTIFTTTVMFDTDRISKDMLEMPQIKSEDTALWWKVLRQGYVAYGLDENLVRYRRPPVSLSSNKIEAIRRIWYLYRKAEGLNVFISAYYFCFWAWRAVARRI